MRAILTYHSIDASESVISTSSDTLARQLDWLASGRVEVLPLLSLLNSGVDADAVAITFDDGFANFGDTAAPLLSARGLTASVFVVAGNVGETNSWEPDNESTGIPRLPLMGWNDLRTLDAQGFDIGGHGMSHRSLAGGPRDNVSYEITQCASVIVENIGRAPMTFAFPYGDHDVAAVELAAKTFRAACTTRFDVLRPGDSPRALPRLDMFYFRDGSMLEKWGTPAFSAFIALRKAGRSVKAAIRGRGARLNGG